MTLMAKSEELKSLLMKVKSENEVAEVRLFTTPWTAAHQAPPSMGFSRQEYWSGVPSPSPWDRVGMLFWNKMGDYEKGGWR